MVPLSLDRLEAFEDFLSRRWRDPAWYVSRGALACSFGLLGLRWSEVEVLRPGDLMPGSGALFVRTRKRGRTRTIEAPGELLTAAIGMRGRVAGGDDRVFVIGSGARRGRGMVYQDVRRFVESVTTRVFGRRYSFHCFRHTAALRVYRRTRDVVAVMNFLGHRSLHWTQAYLATLDGVDSGGPSAFCGGGTVKEPRLFDPDGLGECRVVRSVGARGKRLSPPVPSSTAPSPPPPSSTAPSPPPPSSTAPRKRRVRGKAAGGGDVEAFERDTIAEEARQLRLEGFEVEEVLKGKPAFEEGGEWEGLSMSEALEREEERLAALTEDERAMERYLSEEEAKRRVVEDAVEARSERLAAMAERQRGRKPCTHSELREKRRGRYGRVEVWCKLCGAFYGYRVETK